MQITWLDLLAAQVIGFLWIWGVMAARRWVETERQKAVPVFILFSLLIIGVGIAGIRAGFWYGQLADPRVIVAPVAATP